MKILGMLATLLAGYAALPAANAQDYPAKPIRFIITFSPSGSSDILGRLVAADMAKTLGQPVVAENLAGGGGVVGTEAIAKAAPDGYTIGLVSPSSTSVAAALGRTTGFDAEKLTPISALASYVPVMVSSPSLEPKTLAEVLEYSKAHPGELRYGTSGAGSITHIYGEMFKQASGMDMTAVQYKGGGEVMQGVLNGDTQLAIASYATFQAQIDAGTLRPVAVFSGQRYAPLKDTPAANEVVPKFETSVIWFGIVGPENLPADITAKLNEAIGKALANPEVVEKATAAGLDIIGGSAESFGGMLKADFELMKGAVVAAGLK